MSVDSFPIAMPATPFVEASLMVQRRQSAGLSGAGRSFTIERGLPQWKFTGKTRELFDSEIGLWEAFRDKLRGAARFFTLYQPRRPYPLAYLPGGPSGLVRAAPYGGLFGGRMQLAAIGSSLIPGGIGRDLITIGAPLPASVGYTLSPGDTVSLRQGANLLAVSDFSTGWTATNGTLAANSATDPKSGSTAAVLTRSATGAFSAVASIAGVACAGRTFRCVVWAELGTLTGTVVVSLRDGAGVTAVTTTATLSSSAWTQIEISGAFPLTATAGLKLLIAPTNTAGGSGSTLRLWQSRVTQRDLELLSLHRVLDTTPLVADSAGTLTTWVEPEVPGQFTPEATAQTQMGPGKFALVDLQLPVQAQGRARPGQVTMTAMSVMM